MAGTVPGMGNSKGYGTRETACDRHDLRTRVRRLGECFYYGDKKFSGFVPSSDGGGHY